MMRTGSQNNDEVVSQAERMGNHLENSYEVIPRSVR